MVKLNLGCGDRILEGYINCDLYNPKAEINCDAKKIPFDDNSVDEICNYHLIEHFDFYEGQEAVQEWARALKPGGKLVVETPDFLNTCKSFVDGNEQDRIFLYINFFACPWWPGQQHKFLYTETQLYWTLEKMGFEQIRRIRPDISTYGPYAKEELYLKMECIKK